MTEGLLTDAPEYLETLKTPNDRIEELRFALYLIASAEEIGEPEQDLAARALATDEDIANRIGEGLAWVILSQDHAEKIGSVSGVFSSLYDAQKAMGLLSKSPRYSHCIIEASVGELRPLAPLDESLAEAFSDG